MNRIICLLAIAVLSSCTNPASSHRTSADKPTSGADSHEAKVSLIPTADLTFQVERSNNEVNISIASKKWDIKGFGTGVVGGKSITIDSVCGVRSSEGSIKQFHDSMEGARSVQVYLMEASGKRFIVGKDGLHPVKSEP